MNRDLSSLPTLANVALALGLGVFVGLLTAVYPAWIALGVRPAQILAGRADTESPRGKRLRQALSVLQVAAAMGLASFTLAIYWQTLFAMNASPGFDPAHLLVFELNDGIIVGERSDNFVTALSQQPGIAGVAVSTDAVGRSKNSMAQTLELRNGRSARVEMKSVSRNFFVEYGLKPVAGRLFDPAVDRDNSTEPLVINSITARALGFTTPQRAIGQMVQTGDSPSMRIVGVAPDLRFGSLREAPRGLGYQLQTEGVTLTVRASGSVADAERAVRTVWSRFYPNSILELTPAKDIFAASYADDARLAKLLGFSTLIALLIAAFGIYVLAADSVRRRTKEIALRKLFGTRRTDIGKLVAYDIGAIILLAAVIALPVAAVAIARYLAPFIEQTPLAFWSLAIAPAVALLTAALAAARQAWTAMILKPAVALRS